MPIVSVGNKEAKATLFGIKEKGKGESV